VCRAWRLPIGCQSEGLRTAGREAHFLCRCGNDDATYRHADRGVTAIGIADLPIYIDSAVMRQREVVLGGGNRSSKMLIDPQELLKLPHVEVIEGLARPKEP